MKTSLAFHKNDNFMQMSDQKFRSHLSMISSSALFPQDTVTKMLFNSTITSYFVSLTFLVRCFGSEKTLEK